MTDTDLIIIPKESALTVFSADDGLDRSCKRFAPRLMRSCRWIIGGVRQGGRNIDRQALDSSRDDRVLK